jgi:hypothetical protein
MEELEIPNDLKVTMVKGADVDAAMLAHFFKAPKGAKCLVVGCHDEPSANVLATMGMDVYGVDLREYDKDLPPCNYTYVRGDFCNLPSEFYREHLGTFDRFVSLSAIEHFGLMCYGEGGGFQPYYDIIAMRLAWMFLKEGGRAYVTFPMGGHYMELVPHWRTYTFGDVERRIIQDFELDGCVSCTAGDYMQNGVSKKLGEMVTSEEVAKYDGLPPIITSIFILNKVPVHRLSSDGR